MTAGRADPALPEISWGADGLVPSIVQDVDDGRVLMLGWQDAESLGATVRTGEVHFHSRSRGRLWRKGETSGNVLRLVDLSVDCDRDAVLLRVRPAGSTCHTGARSCFDAAAPDRDQPVDASVKAPGARAASAPASEQGFAWLEELWATIASRAAMRPDGSYTVALLDGGVDAAGRKVTEEATEVLLAAKDDASAPTASTRAALASEAADLLFHALVLLAERGVEPREVVEVLRSRRQSVPPRVAEPG